MEDKNLSERAKSSLVIFGDMLAFGKIEAFCSFTLIHPDVTKPTINKKPILFFILLNIYMLLLFFLI